MNCYGRNARKREALKEAQRGMEICAEHYDLVLLTTLREEYHHGAKWLEDFYKKFVAKYKYYMNRYLTADDSTMYGDRADAYAMKKRLKEIGFDYDAVCEEIMKEEEQGKCEKRTGKEAEKCEQGIGFNLSPFMLLPDTATPRLFP